MPKHLPTLNYIKISAATNDNGCLIPVKVLLVILYNDIRFGWRRY